jgi:hypothetical protein
MRQYALEAKHRNEIITWHRRWVTDGAWLDLAAPRYSPLLSDSEWYTDALRVA